MLSYWNLSSEGPNENPNMRQGKHIIKNTQSYSRLANEFASKLLITLFFLLPGDIIVSWYLSSFSDSFIQLILLLYCSHRPAVLIEQLISWAWLQMLSWCTWRRVLHTNYWSSHFFCMKNEPKTSQLHETTKWLMNYNF